MEKTTLLVFLVYLCKTEIAEFQVPKFWLLIITISQISLHLLIYQQQLEQLLNSLKLLTLLPWLIIELMMEESITLQLC